MLMTCPKRRKILEPCSSNKSPKRRKILEPCSSNKTNKILEACTSLKKTTTKPLYLPSDLVTSLCKKKILEPCSKKKKTVYLSSDLVADILLRLPVKSLQKLRSVCRTWNSMITDQDGFFVAQHLEIQRTRYPEVMSISCTRFMNWFAHVTKPILLNYSPEVSFDLSSYGLPEDDFLLSVTNSCDGLVGVFSARSPLFYVLNPSIGKFIALPKEADKDDVFSRAEPSMEGGIVFDASIGKYKAVRLFDNNDVFVGCEVYTLGDYCGRWKYICDAPFRPYDYFERGCVDNPPVPVLVGGVIYWTVLRLAEQGQEPEIALSFDPTKNKFDVLQHPELEYRTYSSRLVVLDEQLCVADIINSLDSNVIIWAMKDLRKREWVKWYSIRYQPRDIIHHRDSTRLKMLPAPLTMCKDGILVLCNGRGVRDYYDLKERKFLTYEIYESRKSYELVFTYTHTLIWPWPHM